MTVRLFVLQINSIPLSNRSIIPSRYQPHERDDQALFFMDTTPFCCFPLGP